MLKWFKPLTTATFLTIGGLAMAQDKVTLINVFAVPEGRYDETLKMWKAAKEIMQGQPGYISTRLHSALDATATYRLINIAEWESPQYFRAAAEVLRASDVPEVEGLTFHAMLYTVVEDGASN